MTSIDKLKLWDLVRELNPAEICELSDKLAQLKDLLGFINEIAVDGSPVITPQSNDAPQSTFCTPSDDKATTAITPQDNGATPRVRNRPDKPFRLTAEEKFEIFERHSFGETQAAIAQKMGRSLLTKPMAVVGRPYKGEGNGSDTIFIKGSTSSYNVCDSNFIKGSTSSYVAARIARDHPDILERMKAGEFPSVRAAAIEAGIVEPSFNCPCDPVKAARRLLKHFQGERLDTLLAELRRVN